MSGRGDILRYVGAMTIAFVCVRSAPAATVFLEDFEGIDITGGPAAITTGNSAFTTQIANGTFVVTNANPPALQFGGTSSFTGSKYLRYDDGNSQPRVRGPLSSALNSGFVASFDYFEPNETTGSQTAFRFVLSNGDAGTTANRALEINLFVGNGDAGDSSINATGTLTAIGGSNPVAAIDANKTLHVDLVGNFGPNSSYEPGITFPGGSVAQFTYDVYVNGGLAIDNAPFRNNLASANEVALVSGSTANIETSYIDNIRLDNELPVPEPNVFSLAALALVGFAFARRDVSPTRCRMTGLTSR